MSIGDDEVEASVRRVATGVGSSLDHWRARAAERQAQRENVEVPDVVYKDFWNGPQPTEPEAEVVTRAALDELCVILGEEFAEVGEDVGKLTRRVALLEQRLEALERPKVVRKQRKR
jgi:hypothetical protein